MSLLFFTFFNLLCFPTIFSRIPPSQTNTMTNISQQLSDSQELSAWSIRKQPDPCSWEGVICNPTNTSIIKISLSQHSLSNSSFLPLLCQIKTLQSLDLSNNLFTSIPRPFFSSCGDIDALKLLNFSRNSLSGYLPDFHGFVGLEIVDLSYNKMTGILRSTFSTMVSLRILNLTSNGFHDSLPATLGKSLEQLMLSKNSFQGTIPEELFTFKNLTLIDLSENKLSGSLSKRIGELSKLEVLILSANSLTGQIPKEISNIKTLSRFAANQNNFTGTIPITSVKNLDLSYNKLSGYMPSDLLSQQKLQTVDLSYNLLFGPIPSNMSSSLVRLRLGSNSLEGKIPGETFGKLDNLMYLELDNNSLNGVIPGQIGFCKSLLLLNLAQNRLTGQIPVELGNLSNLQVMELQSNKISGEIPDQITKLQNLSKLNINMNLLDGSIPSSISSLHSLINLNLGGNNLSGSIPDSISSMNSLSELQLGSNRIRNPIPRMPQKLQIALNLSWNLFEGPISYNLSCVNLEVLDLSNNRFSGEIPLFLTQMRSLILLTLSNNQLSGVIPNFPPFVMVERGGNPGLTNSTETDTLVAKKGTSSVKVAVIVTIAAALCSVLVIMIIAMIISRRYYKVNDKGPQGMENPPLPLITKRNILTTNIHRKNIDFAKAMEAVSNPGNIQLKTRFSTYYRAIMPSGPTYYVKKLNWSDKLFQLGMHGKFEQELGALGKLSNSNVMTPLAYVLTIDSAYLFYEYTPRGTLFDVLHGSLGTVLDWSSRYSIAVGVAQGLSFLHGCSFGPVLLLDLSSRNILLKSLKEPQIGDIELGKLIDPSKSIGSLSTIAGSVGYIPPEYAYTMRITAAGNVYSYGVILLELLTGKAAVSEGIELVKLVTGENSLDRSLSRTSAAVRSQMLAVLKVATACVSVAPEARPKIKSVFRMLLTAR